MQPLGCCSLSFFTTMVTMAARPIIKGTLQEHVRPALYGFIQSVAASTSLLLAGPVGRSSDVHGRGLPALVLLGAFGSSLLAVAASGPTTAGLSMALVGLQLPRQIDEVVKAAMADATEAEHRLGWMQVLFACGGIGFGAGPMVGKWANASLGFSCTISCLAFALLATTAALWASGFAARPAAVRNNAQIAKGTLSLRDVVSCVASDGAIRLLFLARLFQSCAAHLVFSTLGLFITRGLGEPKERMADLLSFNSVVFVAAQSLQPLLVRASGLSCHSTLALGLVLVVAGRTLLVLCATSFARCLLCYSVTLVGIGFYLPAVSAAITASADGRSLGLTLGLCSTMESLAEVSMPLLGGVIFEWFGPYGPFSVSLLCSVCAAATALTFHHRHASTGGKAKQQ